MRQLNKQGNLVFPGNLQDHLKKAHAAIHGREMWDERYSEVCDLLKKARKLLHDIEREAEAADQQQQGQEVKQVVGKADPSSVQETPARKPTPGPALPGSTMPGERITPGGVRIPERMVTPKAGDYYYPAKKKALHKAVIAAVRQAGR